MPAVTRSSIMDDLCPAIVRSVMMRTRAPRWWAAIMASAILGLVMEYTAMSILSARPSSAIMRSSHSVPGVKYASMRAGALGEVIVRVGNCAPTPTPMANAISITKVHCLTNIQPQTKDHSMKEWSGVDQFKYRTPLPLGQALLYSNSIPTAGRDIRSYGTWVIKPVHTFNVDCAITCTHIFYSISHKNQGWCLRSIIQPM